ncbi:MAG: NYN domain-containing protein [Actinomycetota bacterium]
MMNDRPLSCHEVVLGTGDGYFVDTVRALQATGVMVHVVAVAGHLSRDLARQADSIALIKMTSARKRVA